MPARQLQAVIDAIREDQTRLIGELKQSHEKFEKLIQEQRNWMVVYGEEMAKLRQDACQTRKHAHQNMNYQAAVALNLEGLTRRVEEHWGEDPGINPTLAECRNALKQALSPDHGLPE